MRSADTPARVLYHIVCAAPPAANADVFVALAQAANWNVCVIATPSALAFIDEQDLVRLTGHPVRSSYKSPTEPDILPLPDAIVVAPATFNTMNKWAAGISDTLALGLLTEGIGKGLPIVALPFVNVAQSRHPAFHDSITRLRECGVHVLYGPEILELHEPGTGGQKVAEFPWGRLLAALADRS